MLRQRICHNFVWELFQSKMKKSTVMSPRKSREVGIVIDHDILLILWLVYKRRLADYYLSSVVWFAIQSENISSMMRFLFEFKELVPMQTDLKLDKLKGGKCKFHWNNSNRFKICFLDKAINYFMSSIKPKRKK